MRTAREESSVGCKSHGHLGQYNRAAHAPRSPAFQPQWLRNARLARAAGGTGEARRFETLVLGFELKHAGRDDPLTHLNRFQAFFRLFGSRLATDNRHVDAVTDDCHLSATEACPGAVAGD